VRFVGHSVELEAPVSSALPAGSVGEESGFGAAQGFGSRPQTLHGCFARYLGEQPSLFEKQSQG